MKAQWMALGVAGAVMAMALGVPAQDAEKPQRRAQEPRGPRSECLRTAHRTHRESLRTFMETQREENQAFREGLRDQPPGERIEAAIRHRLAQHQEAVEAHRKAHEALVTAVTACEDMPDEAKQRLVGQIQTRHQEAVALHRDLHERVIAFLKELQASDASPEAKLEALRKFHEESKEGRAGRREGNRPRRGPGPAAT